MVKKIWVLEEAFNERKKMGVELNSRFEFGKKKMKVETNFVLDLFGHKKRMKFVLVQVP